MLRVILAVALTLIATLYGQAGYNWLDVGHGLHPIIAFPIATLAIIGLIVLIYLARLVDRRKSTVAGQVKVRT